MAKGNSGVGLIEVMVSVVIAMLTMAGGALYIGKFQAAQKADDVRNEMVAAIKLARNYAVSMQTPSGFTGNLKYIVVAANSNVLRISAMSDDDSSRDYKTINLDSDVDVAISQNELWFSPYEGKLMKNSAGEAINRNVGETITVSVGTEDENRSFVINSLGLVDDQDKE